MRGTVGDLIVGLRGLWNNRGFAAIAILALGLGIGANTAVFSTVEAMFNFPIPVRDPDRVAFVFTAEPRQGIQQGTVSVDDFLDWSEAASSFSHLSAGRQRRYILSGVGEPSARLSAEVRRAKVGVLDERGEARSESPGGGAPGHWMEPRRLRAYQASSDFFPMTGISMALGRAFLTEEFENGAPRVVVLSYPFWQQELAGAMDVLQKHLTLDGEAYAIVGVTEESFFFPNRQNALFTPLTLTPGESPRDERTILAMARLKPGATAETAKREMETIAERLAIQFPETNEGWSADVVLVRDNLIQGSALGMIVLYGSITFVLLIACVNVANLLLARASVREKEMALRTALGAGRARLVRQLLTEGFLLSAIGGALGLILGIWGMSILKGMIAPDVNIGFLAEEMELNFPMLAHAFGVSFGAALFFGIVPAFKASRPNLRISLNESGRSGQGGEKIRLRSALIIAEVAMAIALLGTSSALIRSFSYIYDRDPGFDASNLLTVQLSVPEREHPEDADLVRFFDEALVKVASVPGVRRAALTSNLPLTVFPGVTLPTIELEGYEVTDSDSDMNAPRALVSTVSNDFFDTFGVSLLRGRVFQPEDIEGARPVVIVSLRLEERFFGGDGALGRRLKLSDEQGAPWFTVVGVSSDIETTAHSIRNPQPLLPQVYVPLAQSPIRTLALALRTELEPERVAADVRQAIWSVSPNVPLEDVQSMETAILRIDTQNAMFMRVLSTLSLIALLLAAIGIYGIIAFAVNQRRREIGIRMALGASRSSILGLVVRRGAILTAIGLALGLLAMRAFVHLLGAQLLAIGESGGGGPLTYLAVSLMLLAIAQLASYLPARRAMGLNPVETLRNE